MNLIHRTNRAREGFNIVGITTNEITFTDLEALSPGAISAMSQLTDPDWWRPFEEVEQEEQLYPEPEFALSQVENALSDLSPRQRHAVELFMQGKTQVEAAAIMGISQPRYFQLLHGERGKGGAFNRLKMLLNAMSREVSAPIT